MSRNSIIILSMDWSGVNGWLGLLDRTKVEKGEERNRAELKN